MLGLSAQTSANAAAKANAVTMVRTDEPIAIVGMACRFPGAPDPDAFWEVLSAGVDMIREIPDDRFDINEYYDPDPDAHRQDLHPPWRIPRRNRRIRSGVLRNFPARGVWIDPQQRLMLEAAWEGLERAGYSRRSVAG